jgi:RNA polymerase-interacting CarD/CdnL/TRCF family regulator
MEYQTGEWVVHCTHGLGKVLGIEERTMDGNRSLYYEIQASDLTIWVPMDENLESRLRLPSSATEFREIISTLSEPAEALPEDFRQRNLQIHTRLKDGGAEARCKVLRDLTAYRHNRALSDHDRDLMTKVRKTLIGEWSFSLSITREEAEMELHRSLTYQLE